MNDAMDDIDLYEDERKAALEEKGLERSGESTLERGVSPRDAVRETEQEAAHRYGREYRTTFTGAL